MLILRLLSPVRHLRVLLLRQVALVQALRRRLRQPVLQQPQQLLPRRRHPRRRREVKNNRAGAPLPYL